MNDPEALSSALNYVSEQRLAIDNSMNQLSAACGAVSNEQAHEQARLKAAQTNRMQADIPTVATQRSLAETQQTALTNVIAQLESVSNSLCTKLRG